MADVQVPPKLVFIVPYRDRESQYKFFNKHMKNDILAERTDYKIIYVHQKDTRDFNRGALKNIGFLYVRQMYPESYRGITLVFNDVDCMPLTTGLIDYETRPGVVKHFYGFTFTLGGIVSITAGDFEVVGGFPNYWSWGYEDNLLQMRIQNAGIYIDRSQFYEILNKNILMLQDGFHRIVNPEEYKRYIYGTNEGWWSIRDIHYTYNEETGFLDVTYFDTGIAPNSSQNRIHDIKTGSRPFGNMGAHKVRTNPRFRMLLNDNGVQQRRR